MGGSYAQAGVSAKNTMEQIDSQEGMFGDWLNFLRYEAGDLAVAQMEAMRELFAGPQIAEDLLRNLFLEGPGMGMIENFLLRPVKLRQSEKDEYNLFRAAMPGAEEAARGLEGLRPYLDELLETGFKTDLTPIIEGERHRLFEDTLPAIAERFGGAISSSGFEEAGAQAAEDLGMFLGEQEVGLNEAAASRRIAGLNMAPGLLTAPTDFRTAFAEALGASGERFRLRKESTRPGGRLLNALGMLSGIEGSQAFMIPGFPGGQGGFSGGGGGGAGAGWAAALPAIAQGVTRLGQGIFDYFSQPSAGGTGGAGTMGTTGSELIPATSTGIIDTTPVNTTGGYTLFA